MRGHSLTVFNCLFVSNVFEFLYASLRHNIFAAIIGCMIVVSSLK